MTKTARKKAPSSTQRKPNGRSSTVTTTRATPRKAATRPTPPARTEQKNEHGGRFAAPGVRLGMTPPEVRDCSGQPECILFGAEDRVEWQFGRRGTDPVGAPTLYVTTLTFAAGRVVSITERMGEAN